MTDAVKEAIEVLRSLPEDEREKCVQAIIDFASQDASAIAE